MQSIVPLDKRLTFRAVIDRQISFYGRVSEAAGFRSVAIWKKYARLVLGLVSNRPDRDSKITPTQCDYLIYLGCDATQKCPDSMAAIGIHAVVVKPDGLLARVATLGPDIYHSTFSKFSWSVNTEETDVFHIMRLHHLQRNHATLTT